MLWKRQPTLEGLDDLKAEQALAKRAMERHLKGEQAMSDNVIETPRSEEPPRNWSWSSGLVERLR